MLPSRGSQWIVAAVLAAAVSSTVSAETPATTAARRVLSDQQAAWNRADIERFMRGYWRDDDIRFAGGAAFHNGWQATLDRYRKSYPDAAAMGKLDFELVEVRELSPVVVYVFGKWHLSRAGEAPDKSPHGLFTLIVEKKGDAWFVTRDHSSAAGN